VTKLDDKILDYLTGALPDHEVADVEERIASDPTLEAEVRFHRQILVAGTEIPIEEPPMELSVSVMDAAIEAIAASKNTKRRPQSAWEKLFVTFTQPALVGAMAVIMVAVVSVGLYRNLNRKPTADQPMVPMDSRASAVHEGATVDEVGAGDGAVAVVAEVAMVKKEEDREALATNPEVKVKSLERKPDEGTRQVRDRSPRVRPARAERKRSARPVLASKRPKPRIGKPANEVAGNTQMGFSGRGQGGGGSASGAGRGSTPAAVRSSPISQAAAPPAVAAPSTSAVAQAPAAPAASRDDREQERVLYASRKQLGRFRTLRRVREKAQEDMPGAGNSLLAKWERDLLFLIQNKRSTKAVALATAYISEDAGLMKEALFVYLYAEALFGAGQSVEAKSLAVGIRGHELYGEVIQMLLDAIQAAD
jgi:hypothetical protein